MLINVKKQFTLDELLVEEKRLGAVAEQLPICEALLEEAIRLMRSFAAAKQAAEKPLKVEAPPPESPRSSSGLNPVLPPRSPRPREPSMLEEHKSLGLARTLASSVAGDGETSPLAETKSFPLAVNRSQRKSAYDAKGNEDKPEMLAPLWAVRDSSNKPTAQTPPKSRTEEGTATDMFARTIYAAVLMRRFRRRMANRLRPALESGRALVRKTSFKLKSHLKAYSIVDEIDRKFHENLRTKAEMEREAQERQLMRVNERLVLSVAMFCMEIREVFFVKVYNFLKVAMFMNHARDMMIVVTRPDEVAVFTPLYFSEAELKLAASDFHRRLSNLGENGKAPSYREAQQALDDNADLRVPPELGSYASRYIFSLGRLTLVDDKPTLLGVENIVTPDMAVASARNTVSGLGDYEKVTLQDWRPVDQGPDPQMKIAFVHALIEAKELVSGGAQESEQLREIQRDLQQNRSDIQGLNERDAVVLNSLIHDGCAPTQKRTSIAGDHDEPTPTSDAKKMVFVRPTSAGAWRRAGSNAAAGPRLGGAPAWRSSRKVLGFGSVSDTKRGPTRRAPALPDASTTASSHKTIPKTTSSPELIKQATTRTRRSSLKQLKGPQQASPKSPALRPRSAHAPKLHDERVVDASHDTGT